MHTCIHVCMYIYIYMYTYIYIYVYTYIYIYTTVCYTLGYDNFTNYNFRRKTLHFNNKHEFHPSGKEGAATALAAWKTPRL